MFGHPWSRWISAEERQPLMGGPESGPGPSGRRQRDEQ